ncbi:type VI secretion system tube protein TssD [Flavitalea sp.]|nr:type VI secretion system tube protein TssD [Flavitalea sp.]
MSTVALMSVEGKNVAPINFKIDSFKTFSAVDGSVTSSIQGGVVSFEIDLEEETDSESFFAQWFADNSKKDAVVDILAVGETSRFLSIDCRRAQCVHYNLIVDQRIDSKTQNSTVLIQLVSSNISIGQSPFIIGG